MKNVKEAEELADVQAQPQEIENAAENENNEEECHKISPSGRRLLDAAKEIYAEKPFHCSAGTRGL